MSLKTSGVGKKTADYLASLKMWSDYLGALENYFQVDMSTPVPKVKESDRTWALEVIYWVIMADYWGLHVIMVDYWVVMVGYWIVMAGYGCLLVITGWLRVIPVFSTNVFKNETAPKSQ